MGMKYPDLYKKQLKAIFKAYAEHLVSRKQMADKPTIKLETGLDLILTKRTASYASNSKDELIFDTRYKLNDTFTTGLNFKRQKYTSTPTSTSDYSGTLIEMDLTATF